MTSIWQAGVTIASTANADNTYKAQRFVATAAQTVFNLSAFSYQVGSGSLIVEINGVSQFIGVDFTETSNSTVTLVTPADLGDVVVIRGFIGGTAAQSAEMSAALAAGYANSAAGFIASSLTSTTVGTGTKVFTIQADKLFEAGHWVIIAATADSTDYMSGPVVSYTSTTLTVDVRVIGGSGTFASWNVLLSGVGGVDGVITNAVQTAASYTLTTTPTLLEVTSTGYGQSVTLPNASSMSPRSSLYQVTNAGGYPVKLVNSIGNIIGFVAAYTTCEIGLVVASAAGTWSIGDNTLIAGTASLANTNFGSNGVQVCIDVGANRELLISSNGYGVIYNRVTNTFGTVVLIRAVGSPMLRATLVTTDRVLVASCSNTSTAFEAVVLSLSGNTITVNTAATATLAATLIVTNQVSSPAPLITVGTSFIIGYGVTGGFWELRAMTVSGTTVTIGAAVRTSSVDTIGNSDSVYIGYSGTGSVIIAASTSDTTVAGTGYVYVTPYTVSGSTLTAGTLAQFITGASNGSVIQKLILLGSGRWYMSFSMNGTATNYDAIVNLSGTTATINSVVRATANDALMDAIVISATKILVLTQGASNNTRIITDSAGTCSVSSAISVGSVLGATRTCLNVVGNYAHCVAQTNVGALYGYYTIDCTTATPVLLRSLMAVAAVANTSTVFMLGSNAYGRVSPTRVANTSYSHQVTVESNTKYFMLGASNGFPIVSARMSITYDDVQTAATCWSGITTSQVWQNNSSSGTITKVECVA